MARKRASMREGPLAELFRATEAAQRQAEGGEEPAAPEAAQIAIPEPEPEERTVEHVPSWEEASRAETPAPPTPRPDPSPLPPTPDPVPPSPVPDPAPPVVHQEAPTPRYEAPAPPPPRRLEPTVSAPAPQPRAVEQPRYADPLPEPPARLNRAPHADSGA